MNDGDVRESEERESRTCRSWKLKRSRRVMKGGGREEGDIRRVKGWR